jgi:DNA invertase Pin-like site-specific DNA recombinase
VNGNCKGVDTEIFYNPEQWGHAAAYCRYCPVLMECRADFANDPHAFAGGMTPQQRADWSVQQKAPKKKPRKPVHHASRPTITPEQVKLMLEIFDSGLVGTAVIARKAGVSKSSAQRILKKHGRVRTDAELIELSRNGGRNWGGRPRSDGETTRAMIKKLYEERTGTGRQMWTPAEIAEMVGVTKGYVYEIHSKQQRGEI